MRVNWSELDRGLGLAHIVRTTYAPGKSFPFHDHDFAEIFWIESGDMEHAWGDAPKKRLGGGDLVMIHPHCHHALGCPRNGNSCTMVNIAFPFGLLEDLWTTHQEDLSFQLPTPESPLCFSLSSSQLSHLGSWVSRLSLDGQKKLHNQFLSHGYLLSTRRTQ